MSYKGRMSELYFEQLCRDNNIDATFIDGTIDYFVEGEKVEIKSACITTKNGIKTTIGRFWFSDEEKVYLRKHDAWIAFIVSSPVTNDFLMLGLTMTKDLKFLSEKQNKIAIHKVVNSGKLISFKDFKKHLQVIKESDTYGREQE